MGQLPRRSGDDRGQGPVLLALHGPGLALLDDAGGGREGGQGEPDSNLVLERTEGHEDRNGPQAEFRETLLRLLPLIAVVEVLEH